MERRLVVDPAAIRYLRALQVLAEQAQDRVDVAFTMLLRSTGRERALLRWTEEDAIVIEVPEEVPVLPAETLACIG
jgi:hypothetical protein